MIPSLSTFATVGSTQLEAFSGSGDDNISTPNTFPTDSVATSTTVAAITPSPPPALTVFITLTFSQLASLEENITDVLVNITETVELITMTDVELVVNSDLSMGNITVLELYVPTASGDVNESATLRAYYILMTSNEQAWITIAETYVNPSINTSAIIIT